MSEFRTIIKPEKQNISISYRDKILFMGSCFSENIGSKMQNLLFDTLVNPFGVVYNPFSVSNSIKNLIDVRTYNLSEIVFYNNLWHSFDYHGKFSNVKKEECLKAINNEITKSADFLKNTDFLIITFGTAFVYLLKESGKVVANCHKFPASFFDRRLLSVTEIVDEYCKLINLLRALNPELKLIFTVSPVRHWKDGAAQNSLSKSVLRIAIDEISKKMPEVYYFPAFEIMMDDLRDYRFYKDDMLHPAGAAVDYIWRLFADSFFDDETKRIVVETSKIAKAAEHRPVNRDSAVFEDFIRKQIERVRELKRKYSWIDVSRLENKFMELSKRKNV